MVDLIQNCKVKRAKNSVIYTRILSLFNIISEL